MSDPAGPVQFSLGDLGGPFGKFSDHSERWTKRTTKTAWSSPEAYNRKSKYCGPRSFRFGNFKILDRGLVQYLIKRRDRKLSRKASGGSCACRRGTYMLAAT